MKKNSLLVLLLAFLSIVVGYLLSGISLVGRAGVNIVYTEYKFLKTWWKGALIVFIVWIILVAIQTLIKQRSAKATSTIIQLLMLMAAIAGLYLSYSDFRNSLSHRWLGQRFHLGVYLFWIGWIIISVFVMLKKKAMTTDNQIENV